MSQVDSIETLYRDFRDSADFFIVYTREAHAADSDWPVQYAKEKGINKHKTYKDRCVVAERLIKEKKLTIPCLIDDIDNKVNKLYSSSPTRVFLVRKDGRLGVAGKRGPRGLRPALKETREWLTSFKKTGREPELTPNTGKEEKTKET